MSKDEILNLADLQLRTGGYDSLSFREIAEKLGISKANIHHHFKSKEQLASQVTDQYMDRDFREFEEIKGKHGHNLLSFFTEIEELFWKKVHNVGSCSICVVTQLAKYENVPENLHIMAQGHFKKMLGLISEVCINAEDTHQLKPGIRGHDVAIQAGMIMQGAMSLGSSLDSIQDAEHLLRGQLVKWTKTVII